MRPLPSNQRGNAVLFVVIALAVLAIIGLAAVEFTGRDMGIARTIQRKSAVDRCAAAARRYLTAQFRQSAGGVQPDTKLAVAFNANGGDETVQLIPNQHIGGVVQALPAHGTQSSATQRGDITNKLFTGASSGPGSYGAVLCRELTPGFPDGGGRESEFEIYVQAKL